MLQFQEIINLVYQLESGVEIYQDAQILSEKLVDYLEDNHKDYEFTDFNDDKFIKYFKELIKNNVEFMNFLEDISFTVEEFINIVVYICPHCFTSNLIKFIRTHYLGKL